MTIADRLKGIYGENRIARIEEPIFVGRTCITVVERASVRKKRAHAFFFSLGERVRGLHNDRCISRIRGALSYVVDA